MATRTPRRRKLARGSLLNLANGAIRVSVDAGVDPVTGKRHRLVETVPADAEDKEAKAEAVRVRLVNQVNERRNPKTKATVKQLVERYLDQHTGAATTVANYRRDLRKHIEPFIGKTKVGELDADMLDSLYAELRRCSEHCRGRYIEHRTDREHVCDDRCRQHECRPLGASGIRQVHFILSGAYRKAVKWKWVSASPVVDAEPPAAKPPSPKPPTAEDAAALVNEAAVTDLDWATMIWLAMTTGMRRGELCALRWSDVLTEGDYTSLWVQRAISKDSDGAYAEQDTKTHQHRLVTLDAKTAELLGEHRERCNDRLTSLGVSVSDTAFLFSGQPDYSSFLTPSSVTHRFQRLADRLGVKTTIHKLRHYSATELIKAGVDVNTVAGRLGHGGGGATTLRVYTAFVSEADQRAATKLATRMPAESWSTTDPAERAKTDPRAPFERVAAELRARVLDGTYPYGAPLPSEKSLAAMYEVATGTAHRAVKLLERWQLVTVRSGHRSVVAYRGEQPTATTAQPELAAGSAELLDLEVVRRGEVVSTVRAEADPNSATDLRRLLLDAVRRNGDTDQRIGDYAMTVRYAGERGSITTFVARSKEAG